MKKLKTLFFNLLRSCTRCYGMGVLESPNGDTRECATCKGRGLL